MITLTALDNCTVMTFKLSNVGVFKQQGVTIWLSLTMFRFWVTVTVLALVEARISIKHVELKVDPKLIVEQHKIDSEPDGKMVLWMKVDVLQEIPGDIMVNFMRVLNLI